MNEIKEFILSKLNGVELTIIICFVAACLTFADSSKLKDALKKLWPFVNKK